jgi:uncharacterized RDD family membrane protein YckC
MTLVNKGTLVLRTFAAVTLVCTFVWSFWFQKAVIGYTAESRDGRSYVAAGSKPEVILLSVLGIVCFCVLMKAEVRLTECHTAPLQLRLAAFLLDIWFFLFVIGGIGSLPSLLLEAQRTGTFQWHFERSYSVPADDLELVLVFVYLALMVLYFVLPLAKRRQTMGCWICRLATVSANGSVLNLPISTAAWRVYMEFSGLIHLIRTVKETDTEGRTWYDRETGFAVVRY